MGVRRREVHLFRPFAQYSVAFDGFNLKPKGCSVIWLVRSVMLQNELTRPPALHRRHPPHHRPHFHLPLLIWFVSLPPHL
jgi:hypothetical protein